MLNFSAFPASVPASPKLEVQADTLGQLLAALAAQIPCASASSSRRDRLHPSFVANLNGDRVRERSLATTVLSREDDLC